MRISPANGIKGPPSDKSRIPCFDTLVLHRPVIMLAAYRGEDTIAKVPACVVRKTRMFSRMRRTDDETGTCETKMALSRAVQHRVPGTCDHRDTVQPPPLAPSSGEHQIPSRRIISSRDPRGTTRSVANLAAIRLPDRPPPWRKVDASLRKAREDESPDR